jgi:hypothetical protein
MAIDVQHIGAAQVRGGRRPVEQHRLPQVGGQAPGGWVSRAVDHRLQRQVVDLDVAFKVAGDQRHQVFRSLVRVPERVCPAIVERHKGQTCHGHRHSGTRHAGEKRMAAYRLRDRRSVLAPGFAPAPTQGKHSMRRSSPFVVNSAVDIWIGPSNEAEGSSSEVFDRLQASADLTNSAPRLTDTLQPGASPAVNLATSIDFNRFISRGEIRMCPGCHHLSRTASLPMQGSAKAAVCR